MKSRCRRANLVFPICLFLVWTLGMFAAEHHEKPTLPVVPVPVAKALTLSLPDEVALEMLPIPAGSFVMGSPSSEMGHAGDEVPHRVTLSKPFWLGKTEVSYTQWRALMAEVDRDLGKSGVHGKKHWYRYWWKREEFYPQEENAAALPVTIVSWKEALLFCEKLTEQERSAERLPTGYEYTLPTEAQWEYACRAGSSGPFNTGNALSTKQANFSENGGNVRTTDNYYSARRGTNRKITESGRFPANTWGLQDMHGNVAEWCLDRYSDESPGEAAVLDPQGPRTGERRVVRGGSAYDEVQDCRSARRFGHQLHEQRDFIGFRVALSPVVAKKPVTQSAPVSAVVASPPSGPLKKLEIKFPQMDLIHMNGPGPIFPNYHSFLNRQQAGELARKPIFVPEETRNLALKKPVTSSDPKPIGGELSYITDGENEYCDGFEVELAPGPQWVQIDLQEPANIYAIAVWHYFIWLPGIYRAVVVQISNEKDFKTGVTTVFNNDYDDDHGLGAGEDEPYVDGEYGRVIPTDGIKGRYVRLWSNGNSVNRGNRYLEVEVHGVPVPQVSNPAPAGKR